MHDHLTAQRETVLDELLVLSAQQGDGRALALLAHRWHHRLLAHACRLTADREGGRDVAQESWIAIVRGLRRLDDASRFPAWAYRIVSNKSRDWVRRRARRRRRDERLAREPRTTVLDPSPPEAGAEEAAARGLRDALAALDRDHRVVLTLYYLEGFDVRRIAAALDVPTGTVKSRLFHARRRLRHALTPPDPLT